MNQEQSTVSMLHMFTHPVFAVENGVVTQVNAAARQLSVNPGDTPNQWLETGKEEYTQFQGGALSLTLCIGQIPYMATVLRSGDANIFHLQTDLEAEDLRSLALTAQCMREPLADIMTVSDLLFGKQDHSAQEEDHLAQLNRSTYRMLRILSNMTDAANCKNRTYNMEVLDLASVINSIAEGAIASLEPTGRKLVFTGLNQPVYTLCDRDMLERAFYNLLSNAIKFSPADSPIHVSLTMANKQVLLTVKNATENFKAEDLGTIFFRYRRLPGLEDGKRGVGLGIPMVRAAAAAHKGTLLLTQDADKQVVFTMSLAIRSDNSNQLRSPLASIDYAGGRNHSLLELSDILPTSAYQKVN